MANKLLTKQNLIILGALVLFAVVMWESRGKVPTITPGQELQAECILDTACQEGYECLNGKCLSKQYPQQGMCNNEEVTIYGPPSFYTDPAMKHMIGMPCSNDDQCKHWPPLSAKGAPTECCMNTGVCIEVKI